MKILIIIKCGIANPARRKTLTNDQIDKNQAYKNLNLYKENQQIKNYMPDIINDNKNYYNATGSPAVLYHGWKGDIKK
ncbi:MAG: hypothetical protein PHO12_08805 [Bacteroidales bacterium]|nr:hypothetical protein [Bacteroidales bacterium]MDD4684943.1 hypothetical protein [Bacteroidales bacterium]